MYLWHVGYYRSCKSIYEVTLNTFLCFFNLKIMSLYSLKIWKSLWLPNVVIKSLILKGCGISNRVISRLHGFIMVWEGVSIAHFWRFIMTKKCSSGVRTLNFSGMNGRCLTVPNRWLLKKWIPAMANFGRHLKWRSRKIWEGVHFYIAVFWPMSNASPSFHWNGGFWHHLNACWLE